MPAWPSQHETCHNVKDPRTKGALGQVPAGHPGSSPPGPVTGRIGVSNGPGRTLDAGPHLRREGLGPRVNIGNYQGGIPGGRCHRYAGRVTAEIARSLGA
jgi:hypothetical protein